MGWIWWLLAPLVVTTIAALVTWRINRPARTPTSEAAILAHRQFLADLADLAEWTSIHRGGPDHRGMSAD